MSRFQAYNRPPTDKEAAYYDVYGVIEDFPCPDLSRFVGILSEPQQASLFSHRPGNVANRFAVMICKNIDNFLRGHQHVKPPRPSGRGRGEHAGQAQNAAPDEDHLRLY
jgi:hypothetical protein